ncbi:MAG: sodium:solute symporter family protein [Thermaerobacter sp.]|nr:sodium:solute symporter family protein [Thermaerobacter sp.]
MVIELAILALVIYTLLLIYLGRAGFRRAQAAEHFIHGGRRFGMGYVFFLVAAMWGSWIYGTELETSFLAGVSAFWFGVAVIIMSILVALLLLTPFRELGFITNSGLIGDRFGKVARAISALVIAFTFPIFAMVNILVAASLFHVFLGWPLWLTLVAATVIIIAYVFAGGIWALAYTQVPNLFMMFIGLVVAAVYAVSHVGWQHLTTAMPAKFYSPWGVGIGIIVVWIIMDIINVLSAQVEYQAVCSCKDPAQGRKGVYLASAVLVLFTALPVFMGMAARVAFPTAKLGLVAFGELILHAPPAVLIIVTLGVWAAALTWSAPLMFSGASSLGMDLGILARSNASQPDLRRWCRWCLFVQAGAILAYALTRPDLVAWWMVFGMTLRNAAIFAPTIAILLWRAATPAATLVSMIAGVATGLFWNALTGFSATVFYAGINPMYMGTAVATLLFVLISVLGNPNARVNLASRFSGVGWAGIGVFVLFTLVSVFGLHAVQPIGLLGLTILLAIFGIFMAAIAMVEDRTSTYAVPAPETAN